MRRFGWMAGLGLAMGAVSAQGQNGRDAALEAIAQQALLSRTAPGFAYAVVQDGRVVFARGYGLADVQRAVLVTPGTRFAVGSISKQFAAVAMLKLVENGKVSLTDMVAQYVPELPQARKITVHMLLNQTSGLHNYPRTDEHPWPTEGKIAPRQLLAILATDKPDFDPGERFEYSNTNYFAVALIVERVSGKTLAEFLDSEIFRPLGMKDSGSGFAAQAGTALAYTGEKASRRLSLDLFFGAGGVVSTAQDMARWDQALLDGRLLKPQSMKLLWEPGHAADGTSVEYAMGFVPSKIGTHREVWHNGLTPGAGGYTFNAIFPDDRLAVIVISNGADFRLQPEKMVRDTLKVMAPGDVAADAPAPPAALVQDPAVTALALKVYEQIRAGKVDDALLTPPMSEAFKPNVLAGMKPIFDQLGTPLNWTLESRQPTASGVMYGYRVTFAAAQLQVKIFIDQAGKVGGYRLTP